MPKDTILSHTSTHQSLKRSDIPAIMQLQRNVLMALPMENRHFCKQRGFDAFARHLGANMPIFGIRHEFGLAAMVMLTDPASKAASNMQGYPIKESERALVIQGLLVDPASRGQRLSARMLDAASGYAVNAGKVALLAKIAQSNRASMETFCRNGFEKVATGVDPVYGHKVVFVGANARDVQSLFAAKRHLDHPSRSPLPSVVNRLTIGG